MISSTLSLEYLSRSFANNVFRGLFTGPVDESRFALEATRTAFDRVLQDMVNLMAVEANEAQKQLEIKESNAYWHALFHPRF